MQNHPGVPLWKYQGTGNDFVVLDARGILDETRGGVKQGIPTAEWAAALCDRHFGIGADGILTVLPPRTPGARARMHITNADGSVPEMCGNGLRCVALYLVDADGGGPRSEQFVVDTDAGPRTCAVSYEGTGVGDVTLSMGHVRLGPEAGLSSAVTTALEGVATRSLAVSVGNPHLVMDVPPDESQALRVGPALVRSAGFPNGTNVEWVVRHGDGLRVLVFERGVGITLACGTGAVASAFAAEAWGWFRVTEAGVPVALPGGVVRVGRAPDGQATLGGPARRVFRADLG